MSAPGPVEPRGGLRTDRCGAGLSSQPVSLAHRHAQAARGETRSLCSLDPSGGLSPPLWSPAAGDRAASVQHTPQVMHLGCTRALLRPLERPQLYGDACPAGGGGGGRGWAGSGCWLSEVGFQQRVCWVFSVGPPRPPALSSADEWCCGVGRGLLHRLVTPPLPTPAPPRLPGSQASLTHAEPLPAGLPLLLRLLSPGHHLLQLLPDLRGGRQGGSGSGR